MLFFAVDFCDMKGCLNYRAGDRCAKNNTSIRAYVKYSANIHDHDSCKVREQIDVYRLEEMLEK